MVSSLALSEVQKLIDTLSLHRTTKKAIVRMIVINDYPDYHILRSRHMLRLAWGSWGNRRWRSFSNSCFSMSRNVLVYLRLLSRTSRMLPSELCSSPSSVNYSDLPATVVAGAAAEVITTGREVMRACLLTGHTTHCHASTRWANNAVLRP